MGLQALEQVAPVRRRRFGVRVGNVGKLALGAAIWTLLVFASLWTQRGQLDRTAESLARIDAVANLKKDMAIRKWASSLGGVYVEESKMSSIDTFSEAERLRAVRVGGERVSLMNLTPIHILLAIQNVSNQDFGSKERLTSLQLRNRANLPDDWEVKALKSLEAGADMVTESVPRRGSHGLMRVMIPMRMEEECLECHRDTLVPVGGLRGGAAMTVNLNAYRAAQEPTWQSIQYWHLGIWLLGLTLLYATWNYSGRRALERERQEEERRENETAFGAMAEGAIITDAAGRIRWVNEAFCRIYGYSPDEVIGQTPRILKSGRHDQGFYRDFWKQLTTIGRWRGELWNRRKSGEVFPEEISIQALRAGDGRIVRYISIFSDITDRKKNEEELTRHREHLEDLVRQRTEELEVARDQAEAASRAKSLFLANMSHELRTPLNAVIGFSQLMDKDPMLTQAQRRNMEIIGSSGSHLLTLINDVLELSKIESGKLQLVEDETDISQVVSQVADMVRDRAEAAGLVIVTQLRGVPETVWTDAVKLRQVLLNLLSNAVKFTPAGRVSITATGCLTDDTHARIDFEVSDTGIGIAPQDLQRIFEPFEQAGTRPSSGGTGLGLTISRQYVQMMGGRLHVNSTVGEGSVFGFSLLAEVRDTVPVASAEQERAPRASDARGVRVLVVDDAADARLLVRSLLEPRGIEILEAGDGIAAEVLVRTRAPNLVLMDWRLPGIDGPELIRRIRSRTDLVQPKIVMLTANVFDEARSEALAAGADRFLGKPFKTEELYQMVEDSLGLCLHIGSVSYRKSGSCDIDLADADIRALSPAVCEHLIRGALSLSGKEMEIVLAEVECEQPTLAAHLRRMMEGLDYHRLWQFLGLVVSE